MGAAGNRLVRVSGITGRHTGVRPRFCDNVGTIGTGAGVAGLKLKANKCQLFQEAI